MILRRISSIDVGVLNENSWGLSESQCLILGRRRSVLPPPAIGLTITNIFILFSIDVLYHRIYHLLHLPLPFCQLRILLLKHSPRTVQGLKLTLREFLNLLHPRQKEERIPDLTKRSGIGYMVYSKSCRNTIWFSNPFFVIPVKTGIQIYFMVPCFHRDNVWIPGFARMTPRRPYGKREGDHIR